MQSSHAFLSRQLTCRRTICIACVLAGMLRQNCRGESTVVDWIDLYRGGHHLNHRPFCCAQEKQEQNHHHPGTSLHHLQRNVNSADATSATSATCCHHCHHCHHCHTNTRKPRFSTKIAHTHTPHGTQGLAIGAHCVATCITQFVAVVPKQDGWLKLYHNLRIPPLYLQQTRCYNTIARSAE